MKKCASMVSIAMTYTSIFSKEWIGLRAAKRVRAV